MKSLILLVASFVLAGCTKSHETARATSGPVTFDFAVYFAPEPGTDPESVLGHLLADEFPNTHDVMSVTHRWENLPDYPPPSATALRYTTHSVTPEQHAAIGQSSRVFVLTFEAAGTNLLAANHLANDLVGRLAKDTDGFPWDDECRFIYSAAAWQEKRVDSWQGELPDVRGQVNMHEYRNPELERLITLGMRKFGLPDLVLTDVPSGHSGAAGNLINALAQSLLEGVTPHDHRVDLSLAKIQHVGVRAIALANPLEGATGRVQVRLREIPRDEGDPDNILWLLEFPEFKGATTTERELQAFASVFGAHEEVIESVPGDPEMRAASERARKLFFEQEAGFRRGLALNERLLVKKGFQVSEGTEYMWVEVTGWTKNAVEGVLANDSDYDKALHAGIRVTVQLKDVYDFLHVLPDGAEEGNETGKVLEKRER